MKVHEKYESISPADFFYRNKEIAGFDNPVRSTYTVVRELVENSLDSCENYGILPEIDIRLTYVDEGILNIRVRDNGGGIPKKYIPQAFGQVFFGSKYRLRQTRGIFGLGGKMAILYGQITTNTTVKVYSSPLGSDKIYYYELVIDIANNKPHILAKKTLENGKGWHGVAISFNFMGEYEKARAKIVEYLWQTTMVAPYASITFIAPDGILYYFPRKTTEMPKAPREVLPHPYGVDIEMLRRLIRAAVKRNPEITLFEFLIKSFQRVGPKTAEKFLRFAGMDGGMRLKKLRHNGLVRLYTALKSFDGFISPDASGLSPIGPDLFYIGIKEATDAEFIHVVQRPPSSYEGHPFIVETAIAYGGKIKPAGSDKVNLYRFANKIPLLYDARNDVSMKIIRSIDWSVYKIRISDEPVAFFVHVCSTKVPYKTVGKEYIAEQPEVAKQIELGIRENARNLAAYLSKKRREAERRQRFNIIEKYLKKIAKYSADLAGLKRPPDVSKLLYKEVTVVDRGRGG